MKYLSLILLIVVAIVAPEARMAMLFLAFGLMGGYIYGVQSGSRDRAELLQARAARLAGGKPVT